MDGLEFAFPENECYFPTSLPARRYFLILRLSKKFPTLIKFIIVLAVKNLRLMGKGPNDIIILTLVHQESLRTGYKRD